MHDHCLKRTIEISFMSVVFPQGLGPRTTHTGHGLSYEVSGTSAFIICLHANVFVVLRLRVITLNILRDVGRPWSVISILPQKGNHPLERWKVWV